jgi:DNA (cytosine-5)-methyltransferase 1
LDFDKYAVETYNANFEHPAVCDDIKNVNINAIEDFDLLLGGFPCQSFSTVNPNKDTNDDRANLYKELVKILKQNNLNFSFAKT